MAIHLTNGCEWMVREFQWGLVADERKFLLSLSAAEPE